MGVCCSLSPAQGAQVSPGSPAQPRCGAVTGAKAEIHELKPELMGKVLSQHAAPRGPMGDGSQRDAGLCESQLVLAALSAMMAWLSHRVTSAPSRRWGFVLRGHSRCFQDSFKGSRKNRDPKNITWNLILKTCLAFFSTPIIKYESPYFVWVLVLIFLFIVI